MSSRQLLNTKASSLTSLRSLREPQRCVSIGACGTPRKRQRRFDDRTRHICAAIDLQQSAKVSTDRLQNGQVASGAAVEVSHVSMAFGDRQVLLLPCFLFEYSSGLQLHMPHAAYGLNAAQALDVTRGCADRGVELQLYLQVLSDICLEVPRGSLHMLVGPNGCGKSTLLKILGGLMRADRGMCHVLPPAGFVFQNPDHQVVMPTVGADVAFGLGRCVMSQYGPYKASSLAGLC